MLFSSILTDAGISFIVIVIGEGKRIQALRRFDFGERRGGSGRDLESFLSYFRYACVCVLGNVPPEKHRHSLLFCL